MTPAPPIVEMVGIGKRFASVVALDDVSLRVSQGSIHAVVGENGAGKTTLMRILYGSLSSDQGDMKLGSTSYTPKSSKDGLAAGVGMVSQHYAIIPELTCIENLILGAEPGKLLNYPSITARATELATRMGFEFDWQAPAQTLSPGANQKLEILKLLWRNASIMILDEPTAMLSPGDVENLYANLRTLADGGATIIVVTHRLREVMSFCDEVTVLRGGRNVMSAPVSATTEGAIAEAMIGLPLSHSTRPEIPLGPEVLKIADLEVLGDRKNLAVETASLSLRAGEIVGLAGVDGNGQRELVEALVGVRRVASGTLTLGGTDITQLPVRARLDLGLRIIPEDRHSEGIVEGWSLEENAILSFQGRPLPEGKARFAEQIAAKFATRYNRTTDKISSLSGGNQQRFVAARALEFDPKLLIAFQPTRGMDIQAGAKVYEAFRELANEGAAVLVIGFDLDELIENCDRILVMSKGKILAPTTQERTEIGRLMVSD